MIKNIVFNTANKEIYFTEEMKESDINAINMWLAPLEKELNDSEAEIEMFLDADSKQHLSVNNISGELHSKVMERLNLFLIYYP
jgi:hypothetical protein